MEQPKLPDQLPMNMGQQDLWSLQPSLCTLDVWIHKGSIHALSEGVKQQERFYCDIFKVYSNIYMYILGLGEICPEDPNFKIKTCTLEF